MQEKAVKTYVSIMQSLGVKLETISHLVGHTTTRITESRYLRVQNEACQDALNRFDQRFGFDSWLNKKPAVVQPTAGKVMVNT